MCRIEQSPRGVVVSAMSGRRAPWAILPALTLALAGFSSMQGAQKDRQEPGVLDLSALHNYARQPVPPYIRKDNLPKSNPITDAGATLGRVLFYDKRLSHNDTVSCASCHQQRYAFSDLPPLSEGVEGHRTERHSMRLVNMRFALETRVRWDKSAATLEKQMTLPIHSHEEMGYSGKDGRPGFDALIAKLEKSSYYPALFHLAFGDNGITEERMQQALAQFVRSIQSFDSKYDEGLAKAESRHVDFPNFSDEENAGKRLFMDDYRSVEAEHTTRDAQGNPGATMRVMKRVGRGLNCAACHLAPEFDIDPVSGTNGSGSRTAEAVRGTLAARVTRAPSLRDVVNREGEQNGGLFHAGQATSLDLVLDNYELSPSGRNFRVDLRLRPNGLPQFLNTTAQERQQLAAFLRTLTGKRLYTDPKWSDPFDAQGNLRLKR